MAKDEEWDWGVDFFDTRDLVERIDYIESELQTDDETREEIIERSKSHTSDDLDEAELPEPYLGDDEREELTREHAALSEFARDIEQYAGDSLRDGNTVIADDHFTEYAEEYAGDLYGAQIVDATWPFDHIDWDEAAEALKQDYFEFTDPEGNSWWVRS